MPSARLITRQDGNGSPHLPHSGGEKGTIERQQAPQTAPRVGASCGRPHAAQAGASTAARKASARNRNGSLRRGGAAAPGQRLVADLDPFSVAPQPLE
jgi:hypothetical protein